MKPLRLTMQAFGSYVNPAPIDFQKPDQNLFLITGDTGSGKTTIFDAIVFALYGEASSGTNKKDGLELQSQFAELSLKPFVELIFSEGPDDREIYQIRRVPRHLRPLKRGNGQTEEKETVSLILPDGTEYAQNKKETDQKIQEIIGLTKNQFMQVVMIAQGEFMKLLREKTDTKKQIFRKLFHTEIYQKLVDILAYRRKRQEEKIQEIQVRYRTEAGHIEVPETLKLQQENQTLLSLIERINRAEKCAVTDMEQLVEELDAFCNRIKEAEQQAQEEQNQTENVRRQLQTQFDQAKDLLHAFGQLEQAVRKKKICEAQTEEIDRNRMLIRQIRQTCRLSELWELQDQMQRKILDSKQTLNEQRKRLPGVQAEAVKAKEQEHSALQEQNQILQEWTKISQQAAQEKERLRNLKETEECLKQKSHEQEDLHQQEKQLQDQWKQVQEQKTKWQEQLQEMPQKQTERLDAVMRKQQFAIGLELLEEYVKAQKLCSRRQESLKQAQKKYQQASAEYQKKHGEYERMRQAFLNMQAGLLAREELKPGQPCPVCGSLEHPDPCRLDEEDENNKCQQEALSAEAQVMYAKCQEAEHAGQERREKLFSKVQELNFAGELSDVSGIELFLKQGDRNLQEQIQELDRWIQNAEIIRKKLDAAEQTEQDLKENQETMQQKMQSLEQELEVSRQNLARLEQEKIYDTEAQAEEALRLADQKRKAAKQNYEQAQKTFASVTALETEITTLISRCEQEIPLQEAEVQERTRQYQQELQKSGMDEENWQQIRRQYRPEQAEEMEHQVEDYDKNRMEAEQTIEAMEQIIRGRQKPEMKQLEEKLKEAQRQAQNALENYRNYQTASRQNQKIYQNLTVQMESRGSLLEDYGRLDHLYRALSGKEPGARMDLETYVPRYSLEQILNAANRRFREMTAGQFALQMYDIEDAGQGRNKGLDLMVYSNVTGKLRDVRTLSGGESFMAALSLALGMADQIQESSSAVCLDVMFIDEGFGSLDEHARNQAVRVLREMAGSAKMIGIISHVTELKQEIEDQLIVTKDEKGSHVRWQIS